jgi:dihydrofolate synthase/folylpolyglutamate synthase
LTVVDSAHNVEGASRLSESLGDLAAEGPIVCVLGLLDDKDAAGFIAAIIARVDVLIATRPLNPRALDAERVASLAKAAGVARVETQPDHAKALVLAREIALAEGGSVVVTGSVHLIGDVVSAPGERIVTAL